jgi:hypothetical protein
MDDANDLNEGDDEVSSVRAENSYVKETNDKKKRPLSLTKKKPTKMHPAVELLSNLSTAMEKAASQKADKLALELEVKAKELAVSKSRAETDAMLKSRELDMMKKKSNREQKDRSGSKHAEVAGEGAAAPNKKETDGCRGSNG